MIFALLSMISAAEAGCVADTDREARWASAPLIVEGVITAIIIKDDAVMEYLQVHTVHKGLLATDGLWLRTQFPYAGCPGAIVYPPGARVYAIGAPDDDQAIAISPCRPDVGAVASLTEDLAAVAAAAPQTAGRFRGADWQRMYAPLPPLDGEDGRRATFSRDGVRYEGAVLSVDDRVVSLLVDSGDLQLVFRSTKDELLPVVTSDWPLRAESGLRWRAGTVMTTEGPPEWIGAPPPPEDAVGLFWRAAPEPTPPATQEVTLLPGRVALRDAPGGPPLLHWDVGLRTVAQQVEHVPGWRQLWIDTDALVGTAWIAEGDAEEVSEGGVVGGMSGGTLGSHDPIRIRVPAGVVLSRADGAALGRTVRTTSLKYLADDGERAWVAVTWPTGELVATVPCAVSHTTSGPCTVAAP